MSITAEKQSLKVFLNEVFANQNLDYAQLKMLRLLLERNRQV